MRSFFLGGGREVRDEMAHGTKRQRWHHKTHTHTHTHTHPHTPIHTPTRGPISLGLLTGWQPLHKGKSFAVVAAHITKAGWHVGGDVSSTATAIGKGEANRWWERRWERRRGEEEGRVLVRVRVRERCSQEHWQRQIHTNTQAHTHTHR